LGWEGEGWENKNLEKVGKEAKFLSHAMMGKGPSLEITPELKDTREYLMVCALKHSQRHAGK